ncbi:MAG: lysylphosphatidylglycerol synthase transmembrane domain-containing protein [Anaerolineales bacterium]|nr:lysylphosphatidylglycerol synthase transmembrane domain-containing protein [Anaerolineales bacterium]
MKLTTNKAEKMLGKVSQTIPPVPRRWGVGNWQLWIGIIFSLGFLFLALRSVDLKETAIALSRVNALILGAAVASYVLSAAVKAIRWQLLLAPRKAPSFGRAFSIMSVGVMVNAFLPARLGDFTRAYLMGEAEADSKVYVLGTVAVEKVADLLFLLLSVMVLLSHTCPGGRCQGMALPEWLIVPARGTALLIAVLLPCFILLTWQRDFFLRMVEWASRFVPSGWREWLLRQTRYGLASLEVVRRPRLLIGLFGWSLIVLILSILTNYLVFMSLELALPVWASLLLLVVLQVGAAVPSSPGRIGVFQYLVILALSIFAVDKNVALGYSIVLYLVIYVPIVLIGGYCLWREKITWQKLAEAAAVLNRLGSRTR